LEEKVVKSTELLDILNEAAASPALKKLMKEAEESAKSRGHILKPWEIEGRTGAIAECKVCGKEVICDTEPQANGIEIHGDAVALDCED
jgi:hypothetical protein